MDIIARKIWVGDSLVVYYCPVGSVRRYLCLWTTNWAYVAGAISASSGASGWRGHGRGAVSDDVSVPGDRFGASGGNYAQNMGQ